jgi:hypothetical protein
MKHFRPRTGDTRVVRRFAWLPVTLECGRDVWLRRYWAIDVRYCATGSGAVLGWWEAERWEDGREAIAEAIRAAAARGASFCGRRSSMAAGVGASWAKEDAR